MLFGGGIVSIFLFLFLISEWNYILFHRLLELFSVVVMCTIFIVAWNTRRLIDNDYLLFLGIGFLFVAVLESVHAAVYMGIGAVRSADAVNQLWMQARTLEAVALSMATLFLTRRIAPGRVFAGFGAATALGLLAIFKWPIFPVCFVEGRGLTLFARVLGLAGIGLLGAAIAAVLRHRDKFEPAVRNLIVMAITTAILSQVCFILYKLPTGYLNMAGHLLKLASIGMICEVFVVMGLSQPLNTVFLHLKRSEQDLRHKRDLLETRVAERTVELNRTIVELELRTVQLRKLAANLIQAEQSERRRLSQLLHDNLQQILVAVRIQLGIAKGRVSDSGVTTVLDRVEDLLSEAIDESRTLSAELSPRILYETGLAPALTWLGHQMEDKYGLKVGVRIESGVQPRDENVALVFFHSARELLFNIVKHARVGQASLALARERDRWLRLTVADEGIGYEPAAVAESIGLTSIRERVVYLGGQMEIRTAPGQGTRVELVLPMDLPETPAEAGRKTEDAVGGGMDPRRAMQRLKQD
ncbi:MAG: MASE3 domain-containing protein [Candidatus Sumerlaeia bacterium]